MSTVPATKGRRIGDILLELGFATEEDLVKANVEQERTGQPLGQILVELGCITRLELASALAEQWSDQSASIKLLPIPPPASAPRPEADPHHDDDQYAARLQDAVAELALRVGAGASRPSEEFDDRVTDLAERVEATVARTQRIEATLATLAESLEGVTGGVEEAFGALQSGVAGLALDLARIDTTVADLTAQPAAAPAADPELAARIEELGSTVAALAERPVGDPNAASRLEELAALVETAGTPDDALVTRIEEVVAAVAAIEERVAELAARPAADPAEFDSRLNALVGRVENVVTPDEVVALHESLVAFEQRLAVLAEDAASTAGLDEQARTVAEQAQALDELRATVVELESRPIGDPDLDDRLARIETRFAERLAAAAGADQIDALAARLDAVADEHQGLGPAVAQLVVRLDEMSSRNDGTVTQLEELQERVETLVSALAEVRHGVAAHDSAATPERLDELGQSLGAVRDEVLALAGTITPTDRIEDLAQRVDELATERNAHQQLAARLEEIEGRLTADTVSPDRLAEAIAAARAELTPAPPPLADPRVDELARDLAALRDGQARDPRIQHIADDLIEVQARLAEMPRTDPIVLEQLDSLASRIERVAGDEGDAALAARLADLERRLPAETVTPDELADALSRTRDDLALTAAGIAPDPRLEEISAAVESLRRDLDDVRHAPVPADPRLEQLTAAVDTVREQVAAVASTPVTDPVVASELDTLSQRLRFLDVRLDEEMATSSEVMRAVDAVRAELASSAASQLEGTLGALSARVDGLAEALAAAAPDTTAAAEELQRLVDERVEAQLAEQLAAQVAERVAEFTRGLEERLEAAAAQTRAGGSALGDASGLEDLLERNRMTIERLGLHLGEHDRALAELMRTRNLPKQLDELAARVDEIAGGSPATGRQGTPGTRREIGTFSAAEPSTGEVKALMRRVEDAEVASQADRDKLMNRLERMASSIDWRLQRLEAAETVAASRSDED
jgi:hypothetical protein